MFPLSLHGALRGVNGARLRQPPRRRATRFSQQVPRVPMKGLASHGLMQSLSCLGKRPDGGHLTVTLAEKPSYWKRIAPR